MFSQNLVDFGRRPNIIRDLSAFAGKRKQEIGAENVFDFTIGSPNIPVPQIIHDTMVDLTRNFDPVALHSYTDARGTIELRQTICDHIGKRYGEHVEPDGIYEKIFEYDQFGEVYTEYAHKVMSRDAFIEAFERYVKYGE